LRLGFPAEIFNLAPGNATASGLALIGSDVQHRAAMASKVAINGDHSSWRQFSTDNKITQSLSVDRYIP
jgi:hypothetical protein